MTARVLVTGSRDWPDPSYVHRVLDAVCANNGWHRGDITVVHGGARGVDAYADDWARNRGVCTEVHKADWARHGRGAGPIRNQAMVNAGADICAAFIHQGSRGASHCADAAERAGIPVLRVISGGTVAS